MIATHGAWAKALLLWCIGGVTDYCCRVGVRVGRFARGFEGDRREVFMCIRVV